MILQDVLAGLQRIPFLSGLPEDALLALAQQAKPAHFAKQANIIWEGEETSSLYIILTGKVRVYSSDDKSKEVTLLVQEQGSYFGELSLLTDEPRSASVVAVEKTTCAVIAKDDFIHWLKQYPDAAITLLTVLSEKVRQLTGKLRQMALSNVYERTIKALLALAIPEGDISVIHDRPTQQELASMVGASREMINKVMHELTKGGYVEIRDKQLIIIKKMPTSW